MDRTTYFLFCSLSTTFINSKKSNSNISSLMLLDIKICDILQGSNLDPLLFLLLINYITDRTVKYYYRLMSIVFAAGA